MNVGTVEGGTNAGWRRVRETPQPWFCGCFEIESPTAYADAVSSGSSNAVKKLNRGSLVNCVGCKQRRPRA